MKKLVVSAFLSIIATTVAAQTNDPIVTDSTSRSTVNSTSRNISDSTSTTTIKSPPPTAVAPAVTTINNDVCAVVASGAVQTQILGISMGGTMRDMNCERIKLSKNLFDMGMKVAAVATLCQDERVFAAMLAAGTPCPVDGKIGEAAKAEWDSRGVLAKSNKAEVGNYATRPVAVVDVKQPSPQQPATEPAKELPKSSNVGQCDAYTGDDSIIRARVCGR